MKGVFMAYDIADFVQSIEVSGYGEAWYDREQQLTRDEEHIPAKLGVEITALIVDIDSYIEDVDTKELTMLTSGKYLLPAVKIDINAKHHYFGGLIAAKEWKVRKIRKISEDVFELFVEPDVFELVAN